MEVISEVLCLNFHQTHCYGECGDSVIGGIGNPYSVRLRISCTLLKHPFDSLDLAVVTPVVVLNIEH